MDEQERRAIDEACLRLLGYEQNATLPALWFGPYDSVTVGKDGPSQDSRHVVPLAEALRARGFWIQMHTEVLGWIVEAVSGKPGGLRARASGETLQEALARCAARAVLGETKDA